jgi:hypothetical protein
MEPFPRGLAFDSESFADGAPACPGGACLLNVLLDMSLGLSAQPCTLEFALVQ